MKTFIQFKSNLLRTRGLFVIIFTLALGVGNLLATDVAVSDVLIQEDFQNGESGTTFSATAYTSTYSSVTMPVAADAANLSFDSDVARFTSTTASNMDGTNAWLNKNNAGYVEIDNIPLYNATKFQAHWAQSAAVTIYFYYKFNGETEWSDGGSYSSASSDATGNVISVTSGKTSVSIKFVRYNNGTNVRIDKLKLVVTEIANACDKSVTIQKGGETNGTFSLNKSGAQASCDGVSVTVTASPATNYYTSSVTESGASASPTISGSGNSWTVAYGANTTGTSTISVTFTQKTLYTVTWYVEGTALTGLASGLTSVYSGDKVTGVPSTSSSDSSCDGEFVGWVKSDNGVVGQKVSDAYTTVPTVFTDAAGSPAITGNTEFHAVFKKRKAD